MMFKKHYCFCTILFTLVTADGDETLKKLFGNYVDAEKPESCAFKTYDYIVVGSGAGGSVVANRLTENENITVLLLEAGGFPIWHSELPLLAGAQQFTKQNWGYLMEKQENLGLGLVDKVMRWHHGKVLGGSSVINYMLYARGNRYDYDSWANDGNEGWSYDEVLPYFKKSERASIKIQDSDYHGTNGSLSVEDVHYRTECAHAFVNACQQVGYPYVDYNGKNQMGVSYMQATIRSGRRCSAEKAFIRPARFRNNFKLCLHSRVSKVLMDRNKIAYGVEFMNNNIRYKAYARKEVVLSAGPFHSPQILMLSGIGPQDHLTEMGIPVVKDLPVGKKLYDHLVFLGMVFTVNKPIVKNIFESTGPRSVLNYIFNDNGPLTLTGIVEAFTFHKTSVANYTENYPDIEFFFMGGGLQTDYGIFLKTMFSVSQKIYKAIWKNLESKYAWSLYPLLLHPKSFGHLKLKSKHPLDAPLLYGNYLTDPDGQDLKTLLASIREIQRIAKAPAFQAYGTEQVKIPVPGCEKITYDTDDYWECAIRHISSTLYHQSSTCKMGPANDSEAVVDPKLRVYGIKKLRVIDTSVIPLPTSGHNNAPAYMIGEKGADLLLEDYYLSH